MENLVRIYSPAQAGRIIDSRLSRIEQNGFRGRAALVRLIRPSNITAGFGSGGLEEIKVISASGVADMGVPEMIEHPELSFRVMRDVIAKVSLFDGRELAEELNRQNPGRKFRIPSEKELVDLNIWLGDQLTNRDKWIWTETEHEAFPGQFVVRIPVGNDAGRRGKNPGVRYGSIAVRLVEDK